MLEPGCRELVEPFPGPLFADFFDPPRCFESLSGETTSRGARGALAGTKTVGVESSRPARR